MAAEHTEREEKEWIQVQKRTFTKWLNQHLKKKGFKVLENMETDWEDGIMLMNVVNALYDIPIPKYNPAPKMRPHKLDNLAQALQMVETAQIKTNFLKSTQLIDHDLKMILGMVWAISECGRGRGCSRGDDDGGALLTARPAARSSRLRHQGHQRGRDDGQGGSAAVGAQEDGGLQPRGPAGRARL
jgi:hypothetical protein